MDGGESIILIRIGVDAAGFANGQLCDLLSLFLAFRRRFFRYHFDVHEDWMLKSLVVRLPVVMAGCRVGAAPQEGLQTDVQTEFVLWREEALDALVLVDLLSVQRRVDTIGPARARLSAFCHSIRDMDTSITFLRFLVNQIHKLIMIRLTSTTLL